MAYTQYHRCHVLLSLAFTLCAHPNSKTLSASIHTPTHTLEHMHIASLACLALRVLRHSNDSMTTATIPLSYSFFTLSIDVGCPSGFLFSIIVTVVCVCMCCFCFHCCFGALRSLRHVAFNACVKYSYDCWSVQYQRVHSVCVETLSRVDAFVKIIFWFDRISSDCSACVSISRFFRFSSIQV